MPFLSLIKESCSSEREALGILKSYRELTDVYLRSAHRRRVERIDAAFLTALEAHKGMRRHNGDPYIAHPLAVARIVAEELRLGSTSICAALLHDVLEHTDISPEYLRKVAGAKVAEIVETITRISGGIFLGNNLSDGEAYRSLLLSLSSDIRVIVVKMAERLHNMRTLGCVVPEKQLKIARETLFVYAPLAERLGLHMMKQQLEDLAFQYLFPKESAMIRQKLQPTLDTRMKVVPEFLEPIIPRLEKAGIKYEITSRLKSAYSIFNKMRKKGIPLDEIYDIYALRIIFENDRPEMESFICHQIFSIIFALYKIHPERIRDWTDTPKENGYRALHVTCMSREGVWVEVQIRSRQMDDLAELGLAAHWKYKTHDTDLPEMEEWMSTIRDILSDPDPYRLDSLDHIRLGLRAHHIFVFNNRGELMRLDAGSTVGDMARILEPGRRCLGGKVNHKLVASRHILQSGDRVELITVNSLNNEDKL